MTYGLTDRGFVTKDFATIRREMETEARTAFGDDVDLGDDSIIGQMVSLKAKKIADMWELLGAIYSSFDPFQAEGQQLDARCALVNVYRDDPQPTVVTVALYGDFGTLVPKGHLLKHPITGKFFSALRDTTLAAASLLDVRFAPTEITPTTQYTVTVNGYTAQYRSSADPDAAEICAGLALDLNLLLPDMTVSSDADYLYVTAPDGVTPFSVTILERMDYALAGTAATYVCTETGAVSVVVNSLTYIQEPIVGLDSVTNLAAGDTGRGIEEDSELRVRRINAQLQGAGTDEAIRQAILNEVEGVTFCRVFSNRSLTPDLAGRPPHSAEVLVQGGFDQDIANTIWENIPAGVEMVGGLTVIVTDSSANPQTIKFSRPTLKYAWIKVVIERYSEETFPTAGAEMVRDAIATYGIANHTIGTDLINDRFIGPCYSVPGIARATVTTVITSAPTPAPDVGDYDNTNKTVGDTELATFDLTRIFVEVL